MPRPPTKGLDRTMSRRAFLAASIAGASVLALGTSGCDPAVIRRLRQTDARLASQRHGVWVWQFSIDGPAEEIAETLAAYGLAAIVKTHDGTDWMSTYDLVDGAIAGPREVETIASIFENAGVPFHAWCVVTGGDPIVEAEMAAQVLDAGARSLTLDVEPGDGFWRGTPDGARLYGEELRRRHEFARIDISIDPRPWKMLDLPLPEFAAFTDGIRPQLYWDHFDDEDHVRAYEYFGFPSAEGRITPEFLVATTRQLLLPFDRWILPIGIGSPSDPQAWDRFVAHCQELAMPEVSIWRYGTADLAFLQALGDRPPDS